MLGNFKGGANMEFLRLGTVDLKSAINNRVYLIFMARDVSVRLQKDKVTRFISFNMIDKEVTVEAKLFGANDSQIEMIIEGGVYQAAIDVKPYDKSPSGYSCIIYNIDYNSEPSESFVDWADNLEECQKVIEGSLPEIIETPYGKIAYSILAENWSNFARWTAASGQHHTRLGELLVHTSEVVQICSDLADYFNNIYGFNFINKPLLISAAMIHDLEKINELNVNINSGKTEYSTHAALCTHIMDILTDVDIQAYKLNYGIQTTTVNDIGEEEPVKSQETLDEEKEAVELLKHCLAAHHGKLEYGSPVAPHIPEAHLLNIADNLSADMYKYNRAFKDLEPGRSSTSWSGGMLVVTYKDSTK